MLHLTFNDKEVDVYRHLGEIWGRKWNMVGKWNKSESFSARKTGLETDKITIERVHRIGKKEEWKKGPS